MDPPSSCVFQTILSIKEICFPPPPYRVHCHYPNQTIPHCTLGNIGKPLLKKGAPMGFHNELSTESARVIRH
jgi:hypothetical protein